VGEGRGGNLGLVVSGTVTRVLAGSAWTLATRAKFVMGSDTFTD